MGALVAVETVLLVLLVVLVAGLLRSHAEILRRLAATEGGEGTELPTAPEGGRSADEIASAAPLSGVTLSGDPVMLSFAGGAVGPTLLAFLTSGCTSCAGFWQSLGDGRLPAGVEPVIVTRGSERESPARLRRLAPRAVTVVMSSQAWDDYAVPGSPYFVLVDRGVRGEGVATAWPALVALVGDAIEDSRAEPTAPAESVGGGRAGSPTTGPADAGNRRARRVEQTLAAAGIGPGHPSLHPGAAADTSSSTAPPRR